MNKDSIIKIRNAYGKDNLKIICDNVYYYNTRVDNILWDDANEVFYATRANEDYHSNDSRPVKIEAVAYEHVQYITCTNNRANAKDIMKKIGYPEGDIDKIINKVAPTGIQFGMGYENKNTYQP